MLTWVAVRLYLPPYSVVSEEDGGQKAKWKAQLALPYDSENKDQQSAGHLGCLRHGSHFSKSWGNAWM